MVQGMVSLGETTKEQVVHSLNQGMRYSHIILHHLACHLKILQYVSCALSCNLQGFLCPILQLTRVQFRGSRTKLWRHYLLVHIYILENCLLSVVGRKKSERYKIMEFELSWYTHLVCSTNTATSEPRWSRALIEPAQLARL